MTRGVAPLSVVPWTDNQKVFMRRIMKLEPRVGFLRAKQVFLIPEAADEKGGDCGLVEMPLHATGAPELIVGRVLEKSDTGGEFVDAIALGGGCERGGAEKEIVGILVERRKRVFFGAFHSERVVVAVSFAESAIVKEIVAHPDVNHRSLGRSEEHTSELQSRLHLVCRLLLEKKKNTKSLSSLSAPASMFADRRYLLGFNVVTSPLN